MSDQHPQQKVIKLQSFQQEAVAAAMSWCDDDERKGGLIVMPTGSGKTIVAVTLASEILLRPDCHHVMIVTPQIHVGSGFLALRGVTLDVGHREYVIPAGRRPGTLLTANFDGFGHAVDPGPVVCNFLARDNPKKNIMVAVIASLRVAMSDPRIPASLDGYAFIFDEAHHLGGDDNKGLVENLRERGALVFGVTATPFRGDGKRIPLPGGTYVYTMLEAMASDRPPPSLDVKVLHINEDAKTTTDVPTAMVKEWEGLNRPRTFIFCNRVEECERVIRAFEKVAPGRVVNASGDTGSIPLMEALSAENSRAYDDENAVAVIVGCGRVVEAANWKHCHAAFAWGKSKSCVVHSQFVGRTLRHKDASYPPEVRATSHYLIFVEHDPLSPEDAKTDHMALVVGLSALLDRGEMVQRFWDVIRGNTSKSDKKGRDFLDGEGKMRAAYPDEERVRARALAEALLSEANEAGETISAKTLRTRLVTQGVNPSLATETVATILVGQNPDAEKAAAKRTRAVSAAVGVCDSALHDICKHLIAEFSDTPLFSAAEANGVLSIVSSLTEETIPHVAAALLGTRAPTSREAEAAKMIEALSAMPECPPWGTPEARWLHQKAKEQSKGILKSSLKETMEETIDWLDWEKASRLYINWSANEISSWKGTTNLSIQSCSRSSFDTEGKSAWREADMCFIEENACFSASTVSSSGFRTAPKLLGDFVVLLGEHGGIYAIDANSRRWLWESARFVGIDEKKEIYQYWEREFTTKTEKKYAHSVAWHGSFGSLVQRMQKRRIAVVNFDGFGEAAGRSVEQDLAEIAEAIRPTVTGSHGLRSLDRVVVIYNKTLDRRYNREENFIERIQGHANAIHDLLGDLRSGSDDPAKRTLPHPLRGVSESDMCAVLDEKWVGSIGAFEVYRSKETRMLTYRGVI